MAIRHSNNKRKIDRVSGKVASLFRGGGYIVDWNGEKTKFYSDKYKFLEVGSTVALYGDFVFDRQFSGDTLRVNHFYVVQSAATNNLLERQMESLDKMAATFESLDIDYVDCDADGHIISGADKADAAKILASKNGEKSRREVKKNLGIKM